MSKSLTNNDPSPLPLCTRETETQKGKGLPQGHRVSQSRAGPSSRSFCSWPLAQRGVPGQIWRNSPLMPYSLGWGCSHGSFRLPFLCGVVTGDLLLLSRLPYNLQTRWGKERVGKDHPRALPSPAHLVVLPFQTQTPPGSVPCSPGGTRLTHTGSLA